MAEQTTTSTIENTTVPVASTIAAASSVPAAVTTDVVAPIPGSKEEILSRVSKFVEQTPAPAIEPVDYNSQEFDKLLEGVTDPAIKEQLIKKSKSLEAGFGKKFQELSELRKKLDNVSQQSQQWTPERVQSLLQDPAFVQAAQAVAGNTEANQFGMTEDEFSQLTPTEKAKLAQMEQKLSTLEVDKFRALQSAEDVSLKSKYQNYDSKTVDSLTTDLLSGKIRATREHLWKVQDYDDAVVRAYKAGLSDRQIQNQERLSASTVSTNSATVTPNSDVKREQGQSAKAHFLAIAQKRLAESKQMAGVQK